MDDSTEFTITPYDLAVILFDATPRHERPLNQGWLPLDWNEAGAHNQQNFIDRAKTLIAYHGLEEAEDA